MSLARSHPTLVSSVLGVRLLRGLVPALRVLAQAIAVAAGVVVVTFLLVRLVPGDPARAILGEQASPEAIRALRAELGLDQSLPSQFVDYVRGLAEGDLGTSLTNRGTPVSTLVLDGLANTMLLVLASIVVSVFVGVALGLWGGTSQRKAIDVVLRSVAMVLLAAPVALVGLVLILTVAVGAGLAPAGGWGDGYPDNLRYLWLPTLALSLHLTPIIQRAVRQRARVVLRDEHIEAAIGRGLSPLRVTLAHVLPNCALPVITLVGLSLGGLVSGAVVVEAVFGLHGTGATLVRAVDDRDYPVIQGVALVAALITVIGNLLAEAAQRAVDPRTRS